MTTPSEMQQSATELIQRSKSVAYALAGVAAVAGIVLLAWPGRTILVVARITGALLVVVGGLDLYDVLRHHRGQRYWGIFAVRAAVNLGFGIALVAWPKPSVGVLVWLLGLDLVLAGVLGLVVRSQLPEELRGALLGRSVITIAVGVAVMAWPGATAKAIAFLVGAAFLLLAFVLFFTARRIGQIRVEVVEA